MINEVKDNLFVLIKSLSKSEKRQFKLFVGRMDSNQHSKYLGLFNLLEQMDTYNEKVILDSKVATKLQLSNLKSHLYKQVLVSLRLNPIHKTSRIQVREQLDFATILYNKGLYGQSLRLLEKAKIQALANEEKYTAYEIVELEKVIESQYITRSLSNRSEVLVTQSEQLEKQNTIATKLSNLSLRLYERMIKTGYAKSDEEYREITHLFYENLPKVNLEKLGFREKLWYYKTHVWYSFLTQDFLRAYKYSVKWVDMFDTDMNKIAHHPVFYLKGNNYLMECLSLLKYPEKFRETLRQMQIRIDSTLFPVNDNLKALCFKFNYINQLNLCFLEGDFDAGLELIPSILEGIQENKTQIDPHHIMLFYYKIACVYFGKEQYENCIVYLKKIINNKELKMRQDLLCFSRILHVISLYEADLDYLIESNLKQTYRYLIKMNDLQKVQEALIRFVRKLQEIYPHDLNIHIVNLYEELKTYENDPYQRRAFLYLDFLSWLESKIQNKPIAIIIKEKAAQQNRKQKVPNKRIRRIDFQQLVTSKAVK